MGWCEGSRWKNALNHDYKNSCGHNFSFTKFSFIDFVLIDRRNLSGKRPHRRIANLPVADFRSQPREMLLLKPLNTKVSVFLFVYWFSFPFIIRKVWTSLSVSDTDFLVLAAIIPENFQQITLCWKWRRLCSLLTFIHSDRVMWKASDVSTSDWWYQIHVKKYGIFSPVLLRHFSELEILL